MCVCRESLEGGEEEFHPVVEMNASKMEGEGNRSAFFLLFLFFSQTQTCGSLHIPYGKNSRKCMLQTQRKNTFLKGKKCTILILRPY